MPWTKEAPPAVAKNWSDAEKAKCVAAGNAALRAGEDEEAAIFACIAAAGKSKMGRDDGFDVEVFAVGKWNGKDFSADDLHDIVTNFYTLQEVQKVPLKLGHNDGQPLTDGMPALGWVRDIWVEGSKLLARFTDVPAVIQEAVRKKLYRTVSVELLLGAEHKGKKYRNVLDAVAILGADQPAVNVLKDLSAYLSRTSSWQCSQRAVFSAVTGDIAKQSTKEQTMDEELKKRFDAIESTLDRKSVV